MFQIKTWQECRLECQKDPECCHWTLYGINHGSKFKIVGMYLYLVLLYSISAGMPGHGPQTCWLKKEKSKNIVRNEEWIKKGPIESGSKIC